MDLCQILREESFLRTIGGHIGQVIAVDNSEAYRAKLFGPRIRILVRDLDNLPKTVVLPRLDEEGVVEYNLEYSGLPHQCGRCRSRDHQVRQCPRRETKFQRRDHQMRHTVNNQPPETQLPNKEDTEQRNEGVPEPPTQLHVIENPTPVVTETINPTETIRPTTPTASTATQVTEINPIPELQPNDINFPQLSSPGMGSNKSASPTPTQTGTPQAFVWRRKTDSHPPDKGKQKTPNVESAPITRQGYRSGRLADDLWDVLSIPNTPTTPRRKLRVIPFISKNHTYTEYLVDNCNQPSTPIVIAHIAELLAGIPWTAQRARQHIVNELSQSLHKILIFNNHNTTPIHKWEQGRWFSHWANNADGEYTCTLYAMIEVPKHKIKVRKGREIGWRKITAELQEKLRNTHTDQIQEVEEHDYLWQDMLGLPPTTPSTSNTSPDNTNPAANFSEVEVPPSETPPNPHA